MLNKIIATTIIALATSSVAFATSLIESNTNSVSISTQSVTSQSSKLKGKRLEGKDGFTIDYRYDDSKFTFDRPDFDTSNNRITDILFFYSPDALEELGHIENIHVLINANVDYNNIAFKNNKIPITRRVAGVLPYPYDLDETKSVADRLYEFMASPTARAYSTYQASYFVLITTFDNGNAAALAALGAKHALLTTYRGNDNKGFSHVLAHELGHNDGLGHMAGDQTRLASYAVGQKCKDSISIMHQSTTGYSHDVPYFSDTNITLSDETCGVAGVSEVAYAMKQAIAGGQLDNSRASFSNIKDVRESSGQISFDVDEMTVSETEIYFKVPFTWSGNPEQYASVEFYTEHDSASESDVGYNAKRIYADHGSQEFVINLNDDSIAEVDEVFYIKFRQPNGITPEGFTQIKVTVTSDEVASIGTVSFKDSTLSVTEGSSGTITLERTGGSDTEISVTLKSEHITTSAGDIASIDSVVTFKDGETSKTITLKAISDTLSEGNETFNVRLTGAQANVNSQLAVTIINSAIVKDEPSSEKKKKGGSTGVLLIVLLSALILVRRRA